MFYVCVDKAYPLTMLFKLDGEHASYYQKGTEEWKECKHFDEEHFGTMFVIHKGENEEQAKHFLYEASAYVQVMMSLAHAINNLTILSDKGYGMCTDYCKSIGRMTNSLYDTFMKGKERFWDVK